MFLILDNFNPRSPRGGATTTTLNHAYILPQFQSTLPTRGSDGCSKQDFRAVVISIHAPHEGERPAQARHPPPCREISIHAPHEGERLRLGQEICPKFEFQSTLPTRGSDAIAFDICRKQVKISIHAPHEGERPFSPRIMGEVSLFQSTLPTRGSDFESCRCAVL